MYIISEKLRISKKPIYGQVHLPVPSGGPEPTYWERTYI